MIRNSSYRRNFRDLLVGVKQDFKHGELAFELLAEHKVGQDGSPPLFGIDIGKD
jgi:hypothetical protein